MKGRIMEGDISLTFCGLVRTTTTQAAGGRSSSCWGRGASINLSPPRPPVSARSVSFADILGGSQEGTIILS